jgi:predicted dinucleotide-binding enzyme
LGDAAEQVIADSGRENFAGKVVIDAMNPLDFSSGSHPNSRSAVTTRSASASSVRSPTPRS